jgi:hypothetical protein
LCILELRTVLTPPLVPGCRFSQAKTGGANAKVRDFKLFDILAFHYHKEVCAKKGARDMERLNKFFDLSLRYVLEPGLNWVLEHPIISVVVVVALVYWSVRGYRIL